MLAQTILLILYVFGYIVLGAFCGVGLFFFIKLLTPLLNTLSGILLLPLTISIIIITTIGKKVGIIE